MWKRRRVRVPFPRTDSRRVNRFQRYRRIDYRRKIVTRTHGRNRIGRIGTGRSRGSNQVAARGQTRTQRSNRDERGIERKANRIARGESTIDDPVPTESEIASVSIATAFREDRACWFFQLDSDGSFSILFPVYMERFCVCELRVSSIRLRGKDSRFVERFPWYKSTNRSRKYKYLFRKSTKDRFLCKCEGRFIRLRRK